MWFVDALSVESLFLASFLTLLIAAELVPPEQGQSGWWNWLQWVKIGGWLVLLYIIYERVVAILG